MPSKVFTRLDTTYTWLLAKFFLSKFITCLSSAVPRNLYNLSSQLSNKGNNRRATSSYPQVAWNVAKADVITTLLPSSYFLLPVVSSSNSTNTQSKIFFSIRSLVRANYLNFFTPIFTDDKRPRIYLHISERHCLVVSYHKWLSHDSHLIPLSYILNAFTNFLLSYHSTCLIVGYIYYYYH